MSVFAQATAFAVGIPLDIYAFHRYTKNSVTLNKTLELKFQNGFMVEPQILDSDF